jgi:hypothetical protein
MATTTPKKNTDSTLALYEDFELDALETDREESKKASSGKMLGKLAEGKTVLRMLPPRKGSSCKTPWRVVWMHYVSIPGLQNDVSFVCPRMEAKLPCQVCTRARQMEASSNPVDQERGRKLMPSRQLFANVIKRAAPEDGVKIWRFGKKVHEQLQEIRDPDQGLGLNFTHPVNGRDLIVLRKGTGQFDTEYKVNVDPKGDSPLSQDATELRAFLEQMHNLDALAVVPSDQEIRELLSGKKPDRRNSGNSAPQRPAGKTASEKVYDGSGTVVDDEDEDAPASTDDIPY